MNFMVEKGVHFDIWNKKIFEIFKGVLSSMISLICQIFS